MKYIIREFDGRKFYSTVYTSEEQAKQNVDGWDQKVVQTFASFGDPADGWMVHTPFGWKVDGEVGD